MTTKRPVTSGEEGTAIVDCEMSAVGSVPIKLTNGTSKQKFTWEPWQKEVK